MLATIIGHLLTLKAQTKRNMGHLNEPSDKIEHPVHDKGDANPGRANDSGAAHSDTRERPWKGFWPPPPNSERGYPYAVKPGHTVTIAGN